MTTKNSLNQQTTKTTRPSSEFFDIALSSPTSATKTESGLTKLSFEGYSGAPVDLSDYGLQHPMVYDLAGIKFKNKIPILAEHYHPIGHTTSIIKTENSLSGEGLASYPGEARDQILEALNNDFPFEASMGLRANKSSITLLAAKEKKTINGRTIEGPMYVANSSVLREMTITLMGRDSNTEFTTKNSEVVNLLNSMDPEQTPTPAQTPAPAPVATPAPATPVNNSNPVAAPVAPINNSTPVAPSTKDLFKLAKLSMAYPAHAEKIDKMVDEGKSATEIENSIKLELYENSLPKMPDIKNKSQKAEQEITIRFALSCGVAPETLDKAGYDKKLIENADSDYKWSFVESLVNIANSSGGRYTGFSDVETMCKFIKNNCNQSLQFNNTGGFSTFDMPNLFQRVTDFMLEERWALSAPFAMTACEEDSNKDFRKKQQVRPGGGELWEEISNEGKLPHAQFGEESRYESDLKTIGQVVSFDRKTIVNDDMGVISRLLEAMVEGAIYNPDVQLGQLMLNQAAAAGTFWVDADNSRTGLALNRANLSTAYLAVQDYIETRGTKSINQMQTDKWTLITGPALEETAWDILKQDRIVNDTTSNTKTGDKNFWFGKMDYAKFLQMSNTNLLGSGTFVHSSSWVLWPSSKKASPYTINFLRGKKRPTIESIDLPGDMLGMGVRGYWDVKINERERLFILRARS
jgi:hypothetical protein